MQVETGPRHTPCILRCCQVLLRGDIHGLPLLTYKRRGSYVNELVDQPFSRTIFSTAAVLGTALTSEGKWYVKEKTTLWSPLKGNSLHGVSHSIKGTTHLSAGMLCELNFMQTLCEIFHFSMKFLVGCAQFSLPTNSKLVYRD